MAIPSKFIKAAEIIGCSPCAVAAIAAVESNGSGYGSTGLVKILFEGHHFYRYTKGKYAAKYPHICYPKWTKQYYGKTQQEEYRRFQLAMTLDKQAALLSTSYGAYQIMGFNHRLCGYNDVEQFYKAMQLSDENQLTAFATFIKRNKLDIPIRQEDWQEFARKYNGPSYAVNKYDLKLEKAYKECLAKNGGNPTKL